MSSIHSISNEYLYQLKISFRQIIPSSNSFYIVFFLFKYFTVILLTHAIYSNSSTQNLFTLSKIIKALIIFKNAPRFSYITLCITLYIILIIFIICFIIIIIKYSSNAKKTDYKLYNIPSNSLHLSKSIKLLFKITTYLYLIIIFFYQHLIEIFFFGIFKIYFTETRMNKDANPNKIIIIYDNQLLICCINCIFIAILIPMMFVFYYISSTETITHSYGYQCSKSHLEIIIKVIFSTLQGLYSTSFYFKEDIVSEFHIIWCEIIIALLVADFLIHFRQINFLSTSIVALFIRLISNFCLVSGIIEVCIYNFIGNTQKNDQRYYLLKLCIDIINAIILTWLVYHLKKKYTMHKLANSLFLSNKSCNIKSLFEFFLELKSMKSSKEKFLYILQLIQEHQQKCSLEICLCHKYKKYFIMMNGKTSVDKVIARFIALGEKKIVDSIMRQANFKSNNKMSNLLFIHCDFLYSIKQNETVALYLCQYYLFRRKNDLQFKYAYLLYELNWLAYRNKIDNCYDKITISFLKENLIYEKVKKIIIAISSDIEKLLYFKSLKNSNSKLLYKCEDILKPLILFINQNKTLSHIINRFTYKHIFDHSIETKYLLYYYIKLFHISLPHKIKNKICKAKNEFPSYLDFFILNTNQNNIKGNKMILFLNNDNKFIIRYLSTEITDFLLFNRNELIGTDFNELLIPKHISAIHAVYMKQYVLSGFINFKRNLFILNKEMKLCPIKINCKLLPTKNSLYSIIVNIEPTTVTSYNEYIVMCDSSFNFLCLSESFENQFYFSIKILHSLKIDFCEFFGINKEKILDHFRNVVNAHDSKNKNKKTFQPYATTSIKNDEIYYYQTIIGNPFAGMVKSKIKEKEGEEEEEGEEVTIKEIEKYIIVAKEKIVNSIMKFGKNMEELGMEREWKWKLNDLFNKFSRHNMIEGETKTTNQPFDTNFFKTKNLLTLKKTAISDSKVNPSPENNFYIRIVYKRLGNIQFFIAKVSEIFEDKTQRDNSEEIGENCVNKKEVINNVKQIPPNDNAFNISTTLNKNSYSLINQNNSASGSFIPIDITKKNESANISQIIDTSKLKDISGMHLMSTEAFPTTKENFMDDKRKRKLTKGALKSNSSMSDTIMLLEQQNKKLNLLKLGQAFLLLIVFVLNLVNFFINSVTINFSLKMFYINAYSFLLSNDIYYGALSALDLCLIIDGIQEDGYTNDKERRSNFINKIDSLADRIDDAASKLMGHYHLLHSYMNKMISRKEMREVYAILNDVHLYHYMTSNWLNHTANSTLTEEIYSFHYYLKSFTIYDYNNIEGNIIDDLYKNNYCRLKQYYFNYNFLKYRNITISEEEYATQEEKFMFYIFANLMTTYINQLENLTQATNEILYKDHNSSKTNSILFNVAILFSEILLYSFIIISIQTSREIFKNRMVFLFAHHENEEVFYEDIRKFKSLTENFNINNANDYTNYKNQLDNYYKTGDPSKGFLFMGKQINPIRLKTSENVLKDEKGSGHQRKRRNELIELKKSLNNNNKKAEDEATQNKEEITQRQFESIAEPKYAFCSIIILCITFVLFSIFEIINIIFSIRYTNDLKVENEFSVNYLQRVPKLNQLVLYCLISVIGGNSKLFIKPYDEYNKNLLSNYYEVTINTEQDSLFQKADESGFAYLYYQLLIIRGNIQRFINDNSMYRFLTVTTKRENIFNENENFCIFSNIVYYSRGEITYSSKEIIKLSNEMVKKCKVLGNGINLSGYKTGLDLTIHLLLNIYLNFIYIEKEKRKLEVLPVVEEHQIAFLNNSDVLLIEENVLQTFQILHQANAFSIRDDIINSYAKNKFAKMLFSIISICFGCGVIFALLTIIVYQLGVYNDVVNEIVKMFEGSIRKYTFKN